MTEENVIDPQAIEALRALSPDDDEAFLRELIEIYLLDTPTRLAEIDSTLASGDANALMRVAHTIKGSSGNFGARNFVRLALDLENRAKAGDLTAAASLVPALKAEYAQVIEALRAIAKTP